MDLATLKKFLIHKKGEVLHIFQRFLPKMDEKPLSRWLGFASDSIRNVHKVSFLSCPYAGGAGR
jgi:hypothetical protein